MLDNPIIQQLHYKKSENAYWTFNSATCFYQRIAILITFQFFEGFHEYQVSNIRSKIHFVLLYFWNLQERIIISFWAKTASKELYLSNAFKYIGPGHKDRNSKSVARKREEILFIMWIILSDLKERNDETML